MALMLSRTYDAFRSEGADENTSREAAEKTFSHDSWLANIEGAQPLHSWMLGVLIALLSMILFKSLS